MSFSRQSLLGLVILLGGGIMLFAMVQQVKKPEAPEELTVELTTEDGQPISHDLKVEPLTADIQTETKLLEQKEKQRQARVQQQQIKTEAFIKEQEAAEKRALAKARAENEQFKSVAEPINDIETESTIDTISKPAVATREELQTTQQKESKDAASTTNTQAQKMTVEPKPEPKKEAKVEEKPKPEAKAPTRSGKYKVKKGDSLSAVARRHNVPVSALAQANKLSANSMLQVGQLLRIPSANRIAQLEKDAAYLETKRKQAAKAEARKKAAQERKSPSARQSAQKKLQQARREAKATDAKGTFGVQVALASDKEKANDIVKKFRSAGYKVKTSQTDRGVRIIVGPERGKVAALALKDKINSDPRVNTTNAWVLYWR